MTNKRMNVRLKHGLWVAGLASTLLLTGPALAPQPVAAATTAANQVSLPVAYRDSKTDTLIATATITGTAEDEFSPQAGEVETKLPTGYAIDPNRPPSQVPMYFGDPGVTTLTVYVQPKAITIPVTYRDSASHNIVGTTAITGDYDTEFSPRAGEIAAQVPTGYAVSTDPLPSQVPMYFGDPGAQSVTVYVAPKTITVPVRYYDASTGRLIRTRSLSAPFDTEFSSRSQEIGGGIPAGYHIDVSKTTAPIPMYFGDPNAESVTMYLQRDDVTVPVYYRDASGALIKTLNLTAPYDTTFTSQAAAITANIPAGYTVDATKTEAPLPAYFGDPNALSVTVYLTEAGTVTPQTPEPATHPDPTDEATTPADPPVTPKLAVQPPAAETAAPAEQDLPATGNSQDATLLAAGAVLAMSALIGLAWRRQD